MHNFIVFDSPPGNCWLLSEMYLSKYLPYIIFATRIIVNNFICVVNKLKKSLATYLSCCRLSNYQPNLRSSNGNRPDLKSYPVSQYHLIYVWSEFYAIVVNGGV